METIEAAILSQGDGANIPAPPPPPPPPSITDTEEMPAAPMIPKARFDAVNARMKRAEADRAEWQQAAEARALELAAALANLEAVGAQARQADSLAGLVTELVAARKTALPDYLRDLVDKLPPGEALRWLDSHAGQWAQRPAPRTDAGARGERGRIGVGAGASVLKRRSY
jgi:hypothetical protein